MLTDSISMPAARAPQAPASDQRIMAFIQECGTVRTPEDFSRLTQAPLREIFPHEILVCGIHDITEERHSVLKMVSHNYPADYYADLRAIYGMADSPMVKKWRATRMPTIFQCGRDDQAYPEEWVRLIYKHDLRNVIGHGVTDIAGLLGSFFLFYRLSDGAGDEQASLLKLLLPNLHIALARVATDIESIKQDAGAADDLLNERQRHILYWLSEGKTNWEVTKIMRIGESNVKYHLKQIFRSLQVHNRSQAIAKARDLGLLLTPEK